MTKLSLQPNLKNKVTYPYSWWDGFLTDEDISKIIQLCEAQELTEGRTFSEQQGTEVNNEIRKSKIAMVNVSADTQWVFEKFASIAEFMNDTFYQYDLIGFDHFQYTVYEGNGDKYDYHTDMLFGDQNINATDLPRKLSFSLCLSDPEEYTGGEFQIYTGGKEPYVVEQRKGRIVAFPSFILHRVTPVTKGVRRSIVIWVIGNKFK